jgi:hypothetical protein
MSCVPWEVHPPNLGVRKIGGSPHVVLQVGVDINQRGQIVANGCDRRTGECHAYVATPLEYSIRALTPAVGSNPTVGTTVAVKVALVDQEGGRISDFRAGSLVTSPCNVKFSAIGGQTRFPICMKYDATTNEFFFNWKLGATGVGPTTLKVEATYKFSMPETITTSRSRAITITQ